MAEPVYLLMAYRIHLDGWSTLRAGSTFAGAMRAAEALLSRRFDSAFKGLANIAVAEMTVEDDILERLAEV